MASPPFPVAVIFDMDGVIIDSNPVIIKAWNHFFGAHGIQLTTGQLNHYVFGRTGKDTLRLVFGQSLDKAKITEYEQTIGQEVARRYEQESKLVPGVTEFIRSLAAAGIPVAIATSAPGENVKKVMELADLSGLIQIVSDGSHAHFPKPHPEIYLTTAERLGTPPSRCLVFEDSFSGIAAARAAGMTVVGLSTTHTAAELAGQTAKVIPDFTTISVENVIALLNVKV